MNIVLIIIVIVIAFLLLDRRESFNHFPWEYDTSNAIGNNVHECNCKEPACLCPGSFNPHRWKQMNWGFFY